MKLEYHVNMKGSYYSGFDLFITVPMRKIIFWDVMPCSLVVQ
jgi:hypothetical protein